MKRRVLAVLGAIGISGCMAGQVDTGNDGDRVEAEIKAIPQLPHMRVCDDPEPGFAACHAQVRTDTLRRHGAGGDAVGQWAEPAAERVQGRPVGRRRQGHRHRRRAGRSVGGERPRHLSLDVRAAAVHDGERLLQEGQPERHGQPAAEGRRRLVGRDRARPRHGVGDLPELQDPARRGDLGVDDQPRRRGEPGGEAGRHRRQQQLRRRRAARRTARSTRATSTTRAWPSSRRRATAATASSTRRRRRASSPSAARRWRSRRRTRAAGSRACGAR